MFTPGRTIRFSTALVLVGLFAACHKGPTAPTAVPPSTTPPPSAGPAITRIDIAGPGTVPPGETAQFTATASFSDGSTRDVTSEANWTSFNPPVLSISTSGLAKAHQTGEASVLATFSGTRSGQRGVIVLHVGTYKVGGMVTEDGGVPIPGARVEAMAGTVVGLSAVTTSGGGYTLLGVPRDIQLRVSKEGYATQVRPIRPTDHGQIDFHLQPLVPRAHVSGSYTLTISASRSCRAALAEEARTQTYTATLIQAGARLTVTLGGANFFSDQGVTLNRFEGAVEPNRVWFMLHDFIPWDPDTNGQTLPDVFVQLTSSFLALGAWPEGATTTISGARLSGTLNGTIETLERVANALLPWRRIASCRATDHDFVLSR